MKKSDAVRRTIKVASAAGLAALLTAGCGSSGGLSNLFSSGSSSSSSSSSSSTATKSTTTTTPSTSSSSTTTATTTSTTPTTPTTTTKTGNSLYVVMTDPVEQQDGSPVGKVTSTSPKTGSQTTASFTRGSWSEVQASTIPKDDGGNDQFIVQQYNAQKANDPNLKIYQRTGTNTASYTNGPAGATTGSGSSNATEYFLSSCTPGTSGCSPRASQTHSEDSVNSATQNGKPVTENTVQVGTVRLIDNSVDKPYGPNENMKYVEVGKYEHSDTTHAITSTGGQGLQQLPNGLYFNPTGTGKRTEGYFFTGTETSAADMTGLASGSNPVTARYQGRFEGQELTTARRQIGGNVDMTADFGKGTVSGNVYGIQAYTNCNGQCQQTAAGYNINMNAKITGSQYQGTAQFASPTTSSPTTVTGQSGTGEVVGGFYGPKAAETAGAVRVNGTAPGVKGTDTTVIGGYGAKKN